MFRAVLNDCFCKNLNNVFQQHKLLVKYNITFSEINLWWKLIWFTWLPHCLFWKWKHLKRYFFKNYKAFNNNTSFETAFLKPIYNQPLKFPLLKKSFWKKKRTELQRQASANRVEPISHLPSKNMLCCREKIGGL